MKRKKLYRILVLFLITSLLGWLLESVFTLFWNHGKLSDRGFLILPFNPIYGIPVVLIYLMLKTPFRGMWMKMYDKLTNQRKRSIYIKFLSWILIFLLYFALVVIIASVLELVTGLIFDKLLKIELWSYDDKKYNLFGYISLSMSLIWGVMITFYMCFVDPILDFIFNKVDNYKLMMIVNSLLILLSVDFIFNLIWVILKGEWLKLY